jgi:hypothetical protein
VADEEDTVAIEVLDISPPSSSAVVISVHIHPALSWARPAALPVSGNRLNRVPLGTGFYAMKDY